MKTLVVYFSAEGNTKKVAEELANKCDYDVFEITPEKVYSKSDINWKNPLSRCNKEFFGKKEVPSLGQIKNFDEYEKIYIGFPIWYGCAPNVVHTFCKKYDWQNKEVVAFATSGGSPIGKTAQKLAPFVSGCKSLEAVLVTSASELM